MTRSRMRSASLNLPINLKHYGYFKLIFFLSFSLFGGANDVELTL